MLLLDKANGVFITLGLEVYTVIMEQCTSNEPIRALYISKASPEWVSAGEDDPKRKF